MQIYIGDDTLLGDLARYIHSDAEFPKDMCTSNEILAYFHESCRSGHFSVADVKRAIAIYMQFGSA
ncbi:YozE family protein [Staphylococcus sp. 11262D007BW]